MPGILLGTPCGILKAWSLTHRAFSLLRRQKMRKVIIILEVGSLVEEGTIRNFHLNIECLP